MNTPEFDFRGLVLFAFILFALLAIGAALVVMDQDRINAAQHSAERITK